MKKFIILKSKSDFSDNGNQSPPLAEEHITTLEEQKALLERAKHVQPPLPLEPPPATPIDFSLPQKQEIEDPEYQTSSISPSLSHQEDSSIVNYIPAQTEEPCEKPKNTICRDFIRGTCSRKTCRFAHKHDLSQLPGVYTFCKNFQNNVCTYPFCKYVHATIFEEQRFYRTGVLPPHALAHHKKPPASMLPLPPPPPPPEEPAAVVPIFANPPPMIPSVEKPVISCVPTANLESRPIDDFMINPPPRDLDHKAKKCKSCDTMEFRLQFNKDKTENMKQSSMELHNKMAILTKKTDTLYSVLSSLIKPQVTKRPEGFNGLSTLLNFMGDSEKKVRSLPLCVRKNPLHGQNLLSNLLLKETSEQLVPNSRES